MRRRIAVLAEPGVYDAWGAATLLGATVRLPAHNVGDLARAAVRSGSAWGRRFTGHMQAGELIPEEVLAEFVADTLDRSPVGWVLFGHPRTVRHAELLAAHGHAPDTVIQVTFDEDRIDRDWRLTARRAELPHLLAEHRLHTAALRAFYRNVDAFHAVPQHGSVEELAADLQAVVTRPVIRGTSPEPHPRPT
ncbi:nucleoside monophosphate kinase [Micromonospora auratinigra]|uniref:Adenylate kinase n=1 Tax=Micromonospora auratinigra TaxID=261654 RepID=A0A1A8ZHM9_9ACTN|nr:nucleoside monophosphate kinase [Micromonospora auratinigra]SBT43534.1 adenylate kinase [Micromonospora auratinigra]